MFPRVQTKPLPFSRHYLHTFRELFEEAHHPSSLVVGPVIVAPEDSDSCCIANYFVRPRLLYVVFVGHFLDLLDDHMGLQPVENFLPDFDVQIAELDHWLGQSGMWELELAPGLAELELCIDCFGQVCSVLVGCKKVGMSLQSNCLLRSLEFDQFPILLVDHFDLDIQVVGM